MALLHLRMFIFFLYFALPVCGGVLHVQKRDWMGNPPVDIIEGDVECFSEYMELWIHRMRIEGLRLWLSAMLRIQVTLASLESLNHQLSACGFGLHKDPDRNYIFRVMYSGCFVQLEHGHYVIVLNLMKRISRFGGRTHNYVMKCPVVLAPPNREHIQCDPDFIQVTRQIPVDSWNNELRWSLALRGSLVVALEDASLIQVNVDIQKPHITVQGRRNTLLSSVQVLQTEGQFLPLKLVSGHYAYSMEATCPKVIRYSSEDTVLHIYKRRMGLTKRGGYNNETLSVSSVSINQTDTFTWSETAGFVKLIVPTVLIQKTKKCADEDGENLQQSFFRIDVVLTFKETNNRMLWTLENTSPCLDYHIASVETHHSVTSKSPVTFTALNPTLLNSVTDQPLLFSSKEPQTSSWTTEKGFSMTSQVFPATESPGVLSGSPWSTGSPETETLNVPSSTNSMLASTVRPNEYPTVKGRSATALFQAATTYLNSDIPVSFVPTMSPNMESDATPPLGASSSSMSTYPELFLDLTNARETSLVIADEPSKSTTDNRIRANTDRNISKFVHFTTSPPDTVTPSLSLERTSTNIIPKTASDITLNTQPVFLTLLKLHQRLTRPSLPSPQHDLLVHSTDPNQTTTIHTVEMVTGTYAQLKTVTSAST